MSTTEYASSTEARANFKEALDTADAGLLVTVQRGGRTTALVDAAHLRATLLENLPARVTVVSEAGGWSAFMEGVPVSADGASTEDAVDGLVEALRDYVEDWEDHLHRAANHARNGALVQLVRLCDDDQLRAWVTHRA